MHAFDNTKAAKTDRNKIFGNWTWNIVWEVGVQDVVWITCWIWAGKGHDWSRSKDLIGLIVLRDFLVIEPQKRVIILAQCKQ